MAVKTNTRVTVSVATNVSEDALQPTTDVAVFSFRQTRFTPATSLRFFSHRSRHRCKLYLQHEPSLVTSSHLSMSIFNALISLFSDVHETKMSVLLSVTSSPQRRTFGILSLVESCCLCFAIAMRRGWNVPSRAKAWQVFYIHERSATAHAARLLSTRKGKGRVQYKLEPASSKELPGRSGTENNNGEK